MRTITQTSGNRDYFNTIFLYFDLMAVIFFRIPIAIISLPQSAYAKNFLRMKGSTVMKLKALDAIGIKTIPICMKYWYELPEHERIEFIKREIIEALKNT